MKISLNIFTNCTSYAPSTDIIENTYSSFVDVFGGNYETIIFIDSHPNYKQGKYYIEALEKLFPVVIKTDSLSDGYIKAVNNTDAEFCVMLEHDWQFNKPLIKHSLEEITAVMSVGNIYHFRFNKRSNIIAGWDIGLKEIIAPGLIYCETSVLSNNPHIIDVKKWREICLPLVRIKPGSKGIEENLTYVGLTGAIYGGLEYPQTVIHQDGRRSR